MARAVVTVVTVMTVMTVTVATMTVMAMTVLAVLAATKSGIRRADGGPRPRARNRELSRPESDSAFG